MATLPDNEDFLDPILDLPRALPPESVWQNIERLTRTARVRTLTRADWYRTLAAAAVVLLVNAAALTTSLAEAGDVTATDPETTLLTDYELYD